MPSSFLCCRRPYVTNSKAHALLMFLPIYSNIIVVFMFPSSRFSMFPYLAALLIHSTHWHWAVKVLSAAPKPRMLFSFTHPSMLNTSKVTNVSIPCNSSNSEHPDKFFDGEFHACMPGRFPSMHAGQSSTRGMHVGQSSTQGKVTAPSSKRNTTIDLSYRV